MSNKMPNLGQSQLRTGHSLLRPCAARPRTCAPKNSMLSASKRPTACCPGFGSRHSAQLQLSSPQLLMMGGLAAPWRFHGGSRTCLIPCQVAQVPQPSSEKVEDASVAPLRVALDEAKARLNEVTAARSRLETTAQEVAQHALESEQAVRRAKDAVFDHVAAIDALKKKRVEVEKRVHELKSMVESAVESMSSEHSVEMQQAAAALADTDCELDRLRASLEKTYRSAVLVEKAAAEANKVAEEAMRAAEATVKEELQAATVVKEILIALEKSSAAVAVDTSWSESPSDSMLSPAAAAALEVSVPAAAPAAAMMSFDENDLPSAVKESKDKYVNTKKKSSPNSGIMKTVCIVAVAIAAVWFLQTEQGEAALQMGSELTDQGVQAVQAMVSDLTSQSPVAAAVVDGASKAWDMLMGVVNIVKEKVGAFHVHEAEESLWEAIVLLLASCICVPLVVSKVPGGNPVLGYLLGGALVGPHALGIIQDVASVQHFAELGVVFLLFNIGLELSLERLAGMAKQVFGMGSLQVLLTVIGVLLAAQSLVGLPVPNGVILGGALAMSSTAVGIKVLEDRGETGSRHGRAIFSVLLFQDLAVVVLLMLIPLLAPSPDGSSVSGAAIAHALGIAALKAVACIVSIITLGRLIMQPVFHRINSFANSNLNSVLTLLVCLGTSLLTSLCGLSLALGAFLAGLLISETEYAHQVEDDIAPYKGLLLGLFFMSVGMEISAQLFVARWREVIGGIVLLIGGKLAVMAAIGPLFGLSRVTAIRSGLLLASGGEFAFVAFGEALSRGVLPPQLTSVLYLVVALTMALIPYLATLGGAIGKALEATTTKAMQPDEKETKGLKNHVIICGFGRHGKVVAQVLSENYIPFVGLDFNMEAVQAGRTLDLPVYFGDAGSFATLNKLGAERAACAIIALDSPGASYRAVWAMHKHFAHVKTYVRAHEISQAVILENAGATVVVPATLEPTLQLAASILSTLDFSNDEVAQIIDDYRRSHTQELTQYTAEMGTTLGYGFGARTKDGKEAKEAKEYKDGKDQLAASTVASLASVSGIAA